METCSYPCRIRVIATGEIIIGDGANYSHICTPAEIANGTPATATDTSTTTASTVNNDSSENTKKKISESATDNSGTQEDSRLGATEVINLGANQTANAGAVFCAGAAVQAEKNPEQSESDGQKCGQSFAAANQMLALNGKLGNNAGFKPDPSVVDTEGAKSIFNDFEKMYGVARDDYLGRILGSRGDPAVIESVTGGKLKAEKLRELAARDAPAAEPEATVSGTPAKGANSRKDELRKLLAKRLADATAAKTRAVPSAGKQKNEPAPQRQVASEKLTPLENPFGIQEATLFDVVHKKYLERERSLVPYRFR